jgi:periplasmic protein TonB
MTSMTGWWSSFVARRVPLLCAGLVHAGLLAIPADPPPARPRESEPPLTVELWAPPVATPESLEPVPPPAPPPEPPPDTVEPPPPPEDTAEPAKPRRSAPPVTPMRKTGEAPSEPDAAQTPAAGEATDPTPAPGPPAAPAAPAPSAAPALTPSGGPPSRPATTSPATSSGPTGPSKAALGAYARGMREAMLRHRRYPAAALQAGLEGTAKIELSVDRRGRLVGKPRVVASSGHAVLDEEALRIVKAGSPYAPPPAGSKEVMVFVIPIDFHVRR